MTCGPTYETVGYGYMASGGHGLGAGQTASDFADALVGAIFDAGLRMGFARRQHVDPAGFEQRPLGGVGHDCADLNAGDHSQRRGHEHEAWDASQLLRATVGHSHVRSFGFDFGEPLHGPGSRRSAESQTVPMWQSAHVAPNEPYFSYLCGRSHDGSPVPVRLAGVTREASCELGEEKSPATEAAGEVTAQGSGDREHAEGSAFAVEEMKKRSAEKWRKWLIDAGVSIRQPSRPAEHPGNPTKHQPGHG